MGVTTDVRWAVLKRDKGCVATSAVWFPGDVAPDECRGKHGWLIKWDDIFQLEVDHVTDRGGIRRDDEAHLIAVCPWHHRGSGWRIDTKERRQREREVLSGLYPAAWPTVE